jgi:outer membrane protein assembly factor BamB
MVADGVVYLTDTDLTSYAVDIESGDTIWTVKTEANHRFPPVVTRDTVYFSGYEATFLALERDSGKPRWRTQLDVAEGSGRTPVVAGETLIVGHKTGIQDDLQGRYIGLDTRCGSKHWSVEFDEERPRGLATDGEMVYAATDHHLSAINPGDGTEHWRVRVTDSTLERPPALAGETVILRDQDYLYARSTTDGSERWNTVGGLEVAHPPTVTSETVYVVESESFNVHALDRETGERQWEYTMETLHEIPAPVTSVPGSVYCLGEFQGFDFRILVLDATTGRKQTEAKLPRGLGTDPVTTPELAVTADGLFTHSHATEGGNPDIIHRFTPK